MNLTQLRCPLLSKMPALQGNKSYKCPMLNQYRSTAAPVCLGKWCSPQNFFHLTILVEQLCHLKTPGPMD